MAHTGRPKNDDPLERRIGAPAPPGKADRSWDHLRRQLQQMAAELALVRQQLQSPDAAERWQLMNRRIDELFGLLNAWRGHAAPPDSAAAVTAGDRGLFVIGHARSGTTVLADALNTSPDVCCLMEPYFYRCMELANFADWFNSMHRGFGNPPVKGYWVPQLGGASARGVVSHLRGTYQYVGEKLAFRQRDKDYDPDRFLEFALAEYPRSPFVCVIRDPIKVTASTIDLLENSDFSEPVIASLVRSQLETYLLILRLSSLVPAFYLLVHEQIDGAILTDLGAKLGVNLERAASVYLADFQRTPHTPQSERLLAQHRGVRSLREIYTGITGLLVPNCVHMHAGSHAESRRITEVVAGLLAAER